MMKKTLAICLGLALILTLCGTFAGALASEVENGIDAIEDAMMKGNTNTSSFFDGMDDLREGTSADTVPTPDDFPSKYNYGSGKIQDYSRDNMLRRLPEPEGNATVLNTAADPEHIQALFLWEEDNVPTKTRFTENMTGYFDSWNFRPYVTAIPVRTGVQPKGAVVLMAGGAYQFRGNYTDSLPTAAALRELGFQTFIVDYRLSPYTQEEGALDVARAVRFVRKNASVYGINPDAIAVMGFSAGGIQAGEFLMHYDEDVTGTALDSRYVPDELDAIPAHASAAGMIYSFYGRLSVGNMDASWLAEGNLPPTFYVYGTEDPFYRQFQQQYDVIRGMGIPTGRIVLNGWPHGFGSDGGWVTDYAAWLQLVENAGADVQAMLGGHLRGQYLIDAAGGLVYHAFHGWNDLDPLAQRRGLLDHIDGYIKNNGCLLAVAGAGVHLGLPLVVVGQHIERDGCAELALALLFGNRDIGGGVLTHGGIIISHCSEHVPDDLLLPRQQLEGLSVELALGMLQAFNKAGHAPSLPLVKHRRSTRPSAASPWDLRRRYRPNRRLPQ